MIPKKISYVEEIKKMQLAGQVRTTKGQVVEIGFFDPKQQPPPLDIHWGLFIKGNKIMVGRHTRSSDNPWGFVREVVEEVDNDWQV